MIRLARVTWRGEFNMGHPGSDKWKPFTATQEYVVGAPGFVWDARIALAPGVSVRVRDGFAAGMGSMRGMIGGLITVIDRTGTPDIAEAALQRHLGEAVWFPTALLPSQGVTWTAVDGSRARASLTADGVTASVEFHFGADGLVAFALVPSRLFDDGRSKPAPHPWRARITGWREMHGVKLPAEAVAEWMFAAGPYAYWRGGPVTIEYDYEQC